MFCPQSQSEDRGITISCTGRLIFFIPGCDVCMLVGCGNVDKLFSVVIIGRQLINSLHSIL